VKEGVIVASCVWDNRVAKKFIHKIVTISEVGSWFPMSLSWSYKNFIEIEQPENGTKTGVL